MPAITRIEPADALLRHAHCDGSVRPGQRLPRDLEPATLAARILLDIRPGEVVCMQSAWLLHTRPAASLDGPVDVVGFGAATIRGNTRRYRFMVPDDDVTSVGGVRVTTAERTLVDLARLAPLPAAAQAIVTARAGLRTAGLALDLLRATVAAQSGLRGIARARKLFGMLLPEALPGG